MKINSDITDAIYGLHQSFGPRAEEIHGGWLQNMGTDGQSIYIYARKDRILPKEMVSEYEGIPVKWIMVTGPIVALYE